MKRSKKSWLKLFIELGAYWEHSGNRDDPHALLTTGGHSRGFVNSKLVLLHEQYGPELCEDLFVLLRQWGIPLNDINCVVGPATGATQLAYMMSSLITDCRSRDIPSCKAYSPEKMGEGLDRRMVFQDEVPEEGDIVLIVEDTITASGSAQLAIDAVEQYGAIVYPIMGVAANRSGQSKIVRPDDSIIIVPVIERKLENWNLEDCPLCATGSEAIRPKEGTNWIDHFTMSS